MTSRQSLGLGLLGFGFLLALGAGCGSSTSGGGTTGGTTSTTTAGQGGGTTTSSTSSTTHSGKGGAGGQGTGGHGTGGGTGGAGGAAAGNHDFGTALDITVNGQQPTAGTLADAATKDFYKFSGKAGDRLTFITRAQGLVQGNTGDDNTIIDTVITLYDANKTAIAQDDDAWPRFGRDSQLFTILPADGEYYVSVEDCNSAFGGQNCAPANGLQTFDYQLDVATTDKLVAPEVWAGASQDGTTAKAVSVAYAVPQGQKPGNYGLYIFDGAFKAAGETHVFSFTPPKDTVVDASQRARAELWVQPISAKNGDGSTANVKVWVADSAAPQTMIAMVDQNNYSDGDNQTNGPIDLSVPVTLDHQYFVFVQSTAAKSTPATDFYFAEHFVGSFHYGQLEAEKAQGANDTVATAETLTTPAQATPGAFFVDGDILKAGQGGDVDVYAMDVPAGSNKVDLFCSAQRAGSGLRSLQVSVLGTDGKTGMASGTEAAGTDMNVIGKTVPGGTTKAYLQVAADSQDANVTGTYYHCTVVFSKQ
jgi:hypothetical protein